MERGSRHTSAGKAFRNAVAAILVAAAFAGTADAARRDRSSAPRAASENDRAWTVHVDNDLFAFAEEDRDYTAGLSVAFAGRAKGLARALDWIDARTRFGVDHPAERAESFEVGLLLFTPNDLAEREPILDDRPYANLAYVASSKLALDPTRPVAYQSSLTVGMLGLPFIGELHRETHEALNIDAPMGYEHQISAGGEPTFRYSVTRHRLLRQGAYRGRPHSLRLGLTGSVGYLTEANAELEFRWGNLGAPWWSSVPAGSEYAGHPPLGGAREDGAVRKRRFELSAGVTLRARLYNSFLQGQARTSAVEHDASDLEHFLIEAWLGFTAAFKNDLRVSYTVRHQTEELAFGRGARGFTWASFGVAQQF